MDETRRATSADVAQRAGVSRATVSYVLNDRQDQTIPESTRQRVRAAAHDLGYTPNAAARSLRAGRSRLVLLVNNGIPLGPAMSRIVDALTAEVAAAGLSLVLWQRTSEGPGSALSSTLAHVDPAVIITLGTPAPAERELIEQTGLPVVDTGIAGDSPAGNLPSRLQVEHLVQRGHRRIGVLSSAAPALARFAAHRTEGTRVACRAAGLPEPVVAAVPTGDLLSVATVTEVLAGWRSGPDPVTAVCCYNDYLAVAVLAAAADLGLDVPQDLAVIGVDDEPFARATRPPLTSLASDTSTIARHVWSRVSRQLDRNESSPPDPGTDPVDAADVMDSEAAFRLVIREST